MLKEYKDIQQEAGSKGKRRWFSGSTLDLIVWYDEKNLYLVKASCKKKGNWEYKLVAID